MRVGERLGGFDPVITAEWIDGALTALVAGPSVPTGPAAVVDDLLGDTWTRTFADPQDVAQALAVLDARWRVLCSQLDPEALADSPDALRLEPLLLTVPAGAGGEALPDAPRLGEDWARGFISVLARTLGGWSAADTHSASVFRLLGPLTVLADVVVVDEAGAEVQPEAAPGKALRTPAGAVDRETLVDAACYAAQDLRLWWDEHAPRTAPRRAEPTPGRNDPCPCGSGKKYKKCHGAQA
jgi:uncharacterized protein